jgi:hypothetical protein
MTQMNERDWKVKKTVTDEISSIGRMKPKLL